MKFKVEGHILQDGNNVTFTRRVDAPDKASAVAMAKDLLRRDYPLMREESIVRAPTKVTELQAHA